MDFQLLSRHKQPRIIPVSIDADGSLAIPQAHITSARASEGVYTLDIKPGFQALPYFFGSPRKDGVARHFVKVPKASITKNQITINTLNLSDTLDDAPVDGFIIGTDGGSPHYGVVDQEVKIPMDGARMVLFHINGTAGTQQAGLNAAEGTLTKQGTGLYTMTFRRPFTKTPYVIFQSMSTTRLIEVATKDNKTITIEAFNSSSGAAADAEFLMVVIGQRANPDNLKHRYPFRCPHAFTFLNPFEYNSTSEEMVRGGQYMSATKDTLAFTFASTRKNQRTSYGLAMADGSNLTAVNTRTVSGFNIDGEANGTYYGLEIAMRRGRYW